MIVEGIVEFACNLILALFAGFELISLPLDAINTLVSIMQYGAWVVGSDILLLFSGSIGLWWGAKLSIGVALWLYEKIPFV